MNLKNLTLFLVLTMILVSCGKGHNGDLFSQLKPDSQFISGHPEIFDAGKIKWKSEWSQKIGDSIDSYGSNLLNITISQKDLGAINCLGFNKASNAQKKQFWSVVFATMANYESGYRPIQMKPRNAQDRVRARQNKLPLGFLQLSINDEWHGKGCLGAKDKDGKWLKNIPNNLQCGVQIMNNQLSGNRGKYPGVIGRLFPDQPLRDGSKTRHYYWSVLTYGDDGVLTSSGKLRYGKKDKVQQRIIDQFNSVENQEMFNFCYD